MLGLLNVFITASYVFLSMTYFHKVLPSFKRRGNIQAFGLWLFAFSLGLFGVARLFMVYDPTAVTLMAEFGHLTLIAYSYIRLKYLQKEGFDNWWDLSKTG